MNLKALFLIALFGVLAGVGVALSLLGWVIVTAYAATVVVLVFVLARRARTQAATPEDGKTCSCCTSTVFDPVEVI